MNKNLRAIIIIIFVTLASLLARHLLEISNPFYVARQAAKVNQEKQNPLQAFNSTYKIIKNDYYDPKLNGQNFKKWKKYQKYIKTQEDANLAIETMLLSLNDPYSRFLNKREYQKQNDKIDSHVFGIGVNIAPVSGKITVLNVIDKTPAFYAGVKSYDIILSINGQDISGKSIHQVAQLIRGPKKSYVKIIFLRNGKKIIKNIARDEIKIETVQSKIIENNVGYIKISSFISNQMPTELVRALKKTEKTDSLIIDIRGNSGGLLSNALFCANLFLREGNMVSVVDRKGISSKHKAEENICVCSKPIIILTDDLSASASEIFAGALLENKRAIIVGNKTYGKGLVQKIYPLSNKAGINLTTAKYLTPKGNDIHHIGIKPNYVVKAKKTGMTHNLNLQLIY